ncbi:MaoC/PaaZ C-terminal domain-containing protein [Glycomyces buryatensis]|uniref:Acyl dehydratase n=1 Tax=Glycomyces buryatensis TaxID=2570927 RepID=A0A4S8QGJ8_9ACTN|nr:MaoC/PaaZ C-terminal domain-containing protein [Glycomyces buryatensis]THV42302.1 acyl dehydratase [Glycomyces buryatensis]
MSDFTEFEAGQVVFATSFPVSREDLVAYADASGDHNPIHLDEAAAKAAGLPDVIAHGMFTMGLVSRAVLEWLDASGRDANLTDFSAKFAKPVVVPAGVTVNVDVEAKVRKSDADSVELTISVRSGADKVLAPARATFTLR